MATFMANASNIERKWYVIDAANKPMGRTATVAATLLRGKHKATYTPHADCGDFVIVINADKAILTGNKLEKKYYRHHTGWVGHLKEVKYSILMNKNPEFAYELAGKPRSSDFECSREETRSEDFASTRARLIRTPLSNPKFGTLTKEERKNVRI